MGKEPAILRVKFPGDTPAVLPNERRAPGKGNAGTIVVSDHALRVRDINRRRQLVENLVKALVPCCTAVIAVCNIVSAIVAVICIGDSIQKLKK
jgi:hypothetical protein